MARPLVVVLTDTNMAQRVMSQQAWGKLASFAEVRRNPSHHPLAGTELAELLSGADGCMTAWGSRPMDAAAMSQAPQLRIIAHSAGSVKPIVTDTVWERGIVVTSAAPAIAVDVAETTLALMIVSIKRVFQLNRDTHAGYWRNGPGSQSQEMNGKFVGLIGAGHVGRRVIELLKMFEVRILVYDPYITEQQAQAMGVTKVSLEELLTQSDIISLHAPATAEAKHLLNAGNLKLIKEGAVFINTARGHCIDEKALINELETGRFFACIDVTDPEPPAADNRLRQLDNVVLTPHIAGCITNCTRLGELAAEELRRFFANESPLYPVTCEMLNRVA